jgi:hypothetical protein
LSLSSNERALKEAEPSEVDASLTLFGDVSALFQNSDPIVCNNIQYDITNRDQGEQLTGLESQVSITESASPVVDFNQKGFDNKSLHLNVVAYNSEGTKVYKPFSIVAKGSTCTK